MLDLITPPSDLVVSLAEAKAHLRITSSAEDALITALIHAATGWCENHTGRGILEQTWKLTARSYPCDQVLRIPRPPLQSVTTFEIVDGAGDVVELVEDTDFRLITESGNDYGLVVPVHGVAWPSPRSQVDAVRLTFVAGYADADAVPGPIKSAVKLITADLYEHREQSAPTNLSRVTMAAEALLAPYSIYSFGGEW